jgi:hypothetical protein
MTNLDPKEQYVRIDTWGYLLIPLKHVPMLEKAAIVDVDYHDGKHIIKIKNTNISVTMVPKEDVAAAIAAKRLES